MLDAAIIKMLFDTEFGTPIVSDTDDVFADTVCDCFRVFSSILTIGRDENILLFDRQIRFIITNSSSIQGVANVLEDYDSVIITIGIINKIRQTICQLFANRRTFQALGSPEKEVSNSHLDGVETILPQCPARRQLAFGAIQRALEYVFIHELAHIFYGHKAYRDKMYNSKSQYPFLMAQPRIVDTKSIELHKAEQKADRLAMEIQADRYAADVTLMFALQEIWGSKYDNWSCSNSFKINLEKQAIKEWVVGLVVVFKIIEEISTTYHTHPHPKLRILAATTSGQVVWTSSSRIDKKDAHVDPVEFLNIVNTTVDEVHDAYRSTGLQEKEAPLVVGKTDFNDLLMRAFELFPKLESRFPKEHVI